MLSVPPGPSPLEHFALIPRAAVTEILRIFMSPLTQAAWPNLGGSVDADPSHTKSAFSRFFPPLAKQPSLSGGESVQ